MWCLVGLLIFPSDHLHNHLTKVLKFASFFIWLACFAWMHAGQGEPVRVARLECSSARSPTHRVTDTKLPSPQSTPDLSWISASIAPESPCSFPVYRFQRVKFWG